MDRPKIGAREAVKDIKSGMTDTDLMEKYSLTSRGLESLFRKLVEAKLLEESFLLDRTGPKAAERGARSPQSPRPAHEPKKDDIEEPSELELAILQDIKDGKHEAEIMRFHEVSPGKLKQIRETLAQAGLLAVADVSQPGGVKTTVCPFCSKEIKASAAKCVHCGNWLEPQASSESARAAAPAASLPDVESDEEFDEEEKECPWEERENYGTLNAYFQTATKCILTPTRFFSKLPTEAGYLSPILFAVFAVPVAGLLTYLWFALFTGAGLGGLIGFFIAVCILFVASLIFVPIYLAISSGVLHLCLYIVGGAREGYQATFRVVSYSSVTSVFNAIPVVGTLVSLWGLVLTVIGLRETHKTTTGKAAVAVAIPVVIAAILAVALGITSVLIPSGLGSRNRDLPNEACQALETYLARVDWAVGLDAQEMESELQTAVSDFVKELEPFKSQPRVILLQQKAILYGLAVAQQTKAGTQSGRGVDDLREDLRKSCKQ
jgi:hypothetical protein